MGAIKTVGSSINARIIDVENAMELIAKNQFDYGSIAQTSQVFSCFYFFLKIGWSTEVLGVLDNLKRGILNLI
jgi:hypothetical protein